MDFSNRFRNHLVVAILSAALICIFGFSGAGLNRSVAAASFTLLFLVLIIGPIMKLWRPIVDHLPWEMPWSWRGELGIWFFLLSLVHAGLVIYDRQGLGTLRLADYIGLVALFWALVLTATSFGGVIKFIGVKSWKWLHSFAYVLFYLVGFHTINHAFLRTGRPDSWIHWSYLVMIALVIVLQAAAFSKEVAAYRKGLKGDRHV
ncbi:MAG: hypothetical protein UY41_C0001G0018 [Candidatus Moranbacteria bacterium GW2011_GWE1_49_15]|nr:MAG: hypothetical protein UX75_C0006G0007 [Candidatus Moranbacteria bacterium GW2011_GWE2_47_10]KKW07590.1 MAG: hypothetical protein UY41_C0001G0018 [Candidatus Moranbacteria bacterium GW2011_GWE1_49_15]HBP01078.1 hypothetical protein [Candidatus Moranbacteria bacterium]